MASDLISFSVSELLTVIAKSERDRLPIVPALVVWEYRDARGHLCGHGPRDPGALRHGLGHIHVVVQDAKGLKDARDWAYNDGQPRRRHAAGYACRG